MNFLEALSKLSYGEKARPTAKHKQTHFVYKDENGGFKWEYTNNYVRLEPWVFNYEWEIVLPGEKITANEAMDLFKEGSTVALQYIDEANGKTRIVFDPKNEYQPPIQIDFLTKDEVYSWYLL